MIPQTQALDRWLHDLRNQLGVILGFSEILLQDLEDGDSKKSDVKEIHLAAGRALEALARPPIAEEPGQ